MGWLEELVLLDRYMAKREGRALAMALNTDLEMPRRRLQLIT